MMGFGSFITEIAKAANAVSQAALNAGRAVANWTVKEVTQAYQAFTHKEGSTASTSSSSQATSSSIPQRINNAVNQALGPKPTPSPGKPLPPPENPVQLCSSADSSKTLPSQETICPLEVHQGQVTFDAEGNDNPNSPYFSRVIHWPGNASSGVTIGRGYDMGGRSSTEIQNDLTAAGVSDATARAMSAAAGLTGADAQRFVQQNRERIGEITHDQQRALFDNIYPSYAVRAEANYNHWTGDVTDRTNWNDLSAPVRDILVDFVYQGFTRGPHPMEAGMHNDIDELTRYIQTTPAINIYEPGRHRADYLENNR